MNTPPDKPPTRESLNAAKRFAASLPALPPPANYEAAITELKRQAAEILEMPKPTDYERGFADGHEAGYQSGLRKAASHV